MWWRTVLVLSLAIIENISAQDDNNGTETQTLCCPCPPGWTGATAGAPVDLASSPGPVVPVASGVDGVDDCPCRARDADAEGAPSVFFPNAVRAYGNVVRPNSKEDTKPLLQPEVGLASSVLETLREATDEEYQEALERDAARAAADEASFNDVISDGASEEANHVVTIIVSPRDMDGSDDAMPEASHVHETRCIHSSLGNTRAFTYRAPASRKGLDDILNLPLPNGVLHRLRDNNLAASNVHESVVRADDNSNNILSGLRLKTEPGLLKLHPKSINENVHNLVNGVSLGNNAEKSTVNDCDTDNSNVDLESLNEHVNIEAVEKSDSVNKLFSNGSESTRQSGGQDDLDCNTSPTNDQEIVFEKRAKTIGPLKSLLFGRNGEEKPKVAFPLKNLFKLRDVELVPLDILANKPKVKINIPSIKLNTFPNTKAREPMKPATQLNLFDKPSKFITENPETDMHNRNEAKSTNIQNIPKRKVVTTEILDAVPSPSDDNCVKLKPEADKSAGVNMEELEDSLLNSSTETIETNDENASDSIDMAEIDTDILDFNSEEQMQLKSSEADENTEDNEDFQIVDDIQLPLQESDTDIQTISNEDISDISPGFVEISDINEADKRSNSIPDMVHPIRTLEEIRKSVVDKLEALQKTNRNALDNIKHNVEEISTKNKQGNEDTELDNVEAIFDSSSASSPIKEEMRDISASSESVSFKNLQEMSDSILSASENHEQRVQTTNDENLVESDENSPASEEISEGEIDNVLKMDGKETNSKNGLNKSNIDRDVLKNVCPTDTFKKPEHNNFELKNTDNDLETLPSDPIMDILRPNSRSLVEHINDLGTKLRQSIVVQPSSLINADNFNIFRTPSFKIPDISGLNANIPTLQEIRSRVSEILDGLARTANDDDGSSEDFNDFASDINSEVFTGASSSDPISILPPLKPLEDINLDIIQLKPLPSILGSSPLTPNLPGLNLNRYKAKLAIPKSLDIKPLNLASTLGSDGGLVGTTLTIGPEKKEKTGKMKFKSNNKGDFVKLSHVTSNNNPTLADITSNMHKNAMNLLNIPKSTKRLNLQATNVMDNLAEKIKSHAEDTVKSIHETLNPSSVDLFNIHNNVLKNANNLLASGRNNLQKTLQSSAPIESAVDNLRSQTEKTFQQLHNTLHSPGVADLSSVIPKNVHSVLKSPKNYIDATVDNIRAHSQNTFRNIQQSLDPSPMVDLSDSIQKTAQNILQSSAAIAPTRNLLGNSIQVIPPIDEVATVQKHAQNLLESPISLAGRGAFEQVLQASPPINLTPHVEQVAKDLQKTLKATLKKNPLKDLPPLPHPNDVLQIISDHHEDVNDKLKALHMDLTDRLESIHNEVTDPERLRSILTPPGNRNFELFAIPLPMSSRSASSALKQTRPTLQAKQPSIKITSQKKQPKKVSTASKFRPETAKPNSMRTSTGKDSPPKSFRMPSAASSPVPTRIERPTLSLVPKKPLGSENIKKPVFPKLKPLVKNKATITFGSTTQGPTPVPKSNRIVSTTEKPKVATAKRFKPKELIRQPTPWNGWGEAKTTPKPLGDPLISSSQIDPNARTSSKTIKSNRPPNTRVPSRLPPISPKHTSQSVSTKPKSKLTSALQGRASTPSRLLSSQNNPKSPLLTKLTDALKSKQTHSNLSQIPRSREMAPAASDFHEKVVAMEEPLKENVQYKCKMMCVKVDLNEE